MATTIKNVSKEAKKLLGLIEAGLINLGDLKALLEKVRDLDSEAKPAKRRNLKDQRIMNFEAFYNNRRLKKKT